MKKPQLLTPLIITSILIQLPFHDSKRVELTPRRAYQCNANRKCHYNPDNPLAYRGPEAYGLALCQMICEPSGTFWPKPTGQVSLSRRTKAVSLNGVGFLEREGQKTHGELLLRQMQQAFVQTLRTTYDPMENLDNELGFPTTIEVKVLDLSEVQLRLSTDESYSLMTSCFPDKVKVKITAKTSFGARHGLETLSQLIIFNDFDDTLRIVCDAVIFDAPTFPYRGVMIDTARNFLPVETIQKLIDTMSYNKLNRLHWHISDAESFPMQIIAVPNMTFYGAYDHEKVYYQHDIQRLVSHARTRGISIVPEIDTPTHVGEGWQWGPAAGLGDLVLCQGDLSLEVMGSPTGGYLNVTNPHVYDLLRNIYSEALKSFEPDIFHMGGREVDFDCWNRSKAIHDWLRRNGQFRNDNGFFQLWAEFQQRALQLLVSADYSKDLEVMISANRLTSERASQYILPNYKRYIIQASGDSSSNEVPELLNKGFRIVVSNSDAWRLDCGFGSWKMEGEDMCAPYKSWSRMYNNKPYESLEGEWFISEPYQRSLILGGEGQLWGSQVDASSLEGKLWPRAAAIAERLWSDPPDCFVEAERRMLMHRERLVERGVRADALQPYWCLRGVEGCLIDPRRWRDLGVKSTCDKYSGKYNKSPGTSLRRKNVEKSNADDKDSRTPILVAGIPIDLLKGGSDNKVFRRTFSTKNNGGRPGFDLMDFNIEIFLGKFSVFRKLYWLIMLIMQCCIVGLCL